MAIAVKPGFTPKANPAPRNRFKAGSPNLLKLTDVFGAAFFKKLRKRRNFFKKPGNPKPPYLSSPFKNRKLASFAALEIPLILFARVDIFKNGSGFNLYPAQGLQVLGEQGARAAIA